MKAFRFIIFSALTLAMTASLTISTAQRDGNGGTREQFQRGRGEMRRGAGMSDPYRQAKQFVRRFDANDDGFVSPEEFTGNPRRLNELDTNGDGMVSTEEYAAQAGRRYQRMLNQNPIQNPEAQPIHHPPGVPPEVLEALKKLDTNENETLSLEEFKSGVDALFQALDRNDDGELDQQEIGMPPPPPTEEERMEIARANRERFVTRVMERMDANDDGQITKEEWNGPRGRFNRIDINSDGVVDLEELSGSLERIAGQGGRNVARMLQSDRIARQNDQASLVERTIHQRDANQNGRLERNEFQGDDASFQQADQDDDDGVNLTEAQQYVQRRMNEATRHGHRGENQHGEFALVDLNAQALLQRYDVDDDGTILREEFDERRGDAALFAIIDTSQDNIISGKELEAFEARLEEDPQLRQRLMQSQFQNNMEPLRGKGRHRAGMMQHSPGMGMDMKQMHHPPQDDHAPFDWEPMPGQDAPQPPPSVAPQNDNTPDIQNIL